MRIAILLSLLCGCFGLVFGQASALHVDICHGNNIRLKANSVGADSYNWYRNDVLLETTHGSELLVTDKGVYRSSAKNNEGCVSGISSEINVGFAHPVAINDVVSGDKGKELIVDVLFNDTHPCVPLNPATLTIMQLPVNGVVTISNGKLVYKPNPGFSGTDHFSYKISDQSGETSDPGIVTVEVLNPLPVVLISLLAQKEGASALLTWTTVKEFNASHFEIQRSQDAKSWAEIGRVETGGLSGERQDYHFTDIAPEPGNDYYRLKMVDLDGQFAYSSIRSLHFESLPWAVIYPNPVQEQLKINVRDKSVRSIRLNDSYGRVLLTIPVFFPELSIDMQSYKPGIYFIKAQQGNGTYEVFKVIRE